MLKELPGDDAKGHVPPSKTEIAAFVAALGRSLRRRGLKVAFLTVIPGEVRG